MKNSAFKMRITKILKANGIQKSEWVKEWGHPKYLKAGFTYSDMFYMLGYYIPENIFTKEERIKKQQAKITEIYDILIANSLGPYIKKHALCIEWFINNGEVIEKSN